VSTLLLQSLAVLTLVTGMALFAGWRLGLARARKREFEEDDDDTVPTRAPDAEALERLERRIDAMIDLCRRAVEGSGEVTAATLDELRRLFHDRPLSTGGETRPGDAAAFVEASVHRQLETVLAENERIILALRDKEETFLRLEEQLHHRLREADEALAEEHRLVETLERRLHELENKVDPALVGPDDLGMIRGIGTSSKKILEQMGIRSFRDLALISADDLEKLKSKVPFPDRIVREDWIGQAIERHFRKYSERLINPNHPPGRRKVA
jgi:predicted flap endonuclease-1-like 5' DNA nuclease